LLNNAAQGASCQGMTLQLSEKPLRKGLRVTARLYSLLKNPAHQALCQGMTSVVPPKLHILLSLALATVQFRGPKMHFSASCFVVPINALNWPGFSR